MKDNLTPVLLEAAGGRTQKIQNPYMHTSDT